MDDVDISKPGMVICIKYTDVLCREGRINPYNDVRKEIGREKIRREEKRL